MKKILIFHHHGGIGGAGLSLIHIVKSLKDDNREIIIYCPNIPNEIITLLSEFDCKVVETKKSPKIFPHYSGGIKNMFSIRSLKNLFDIALDMPKIKKIIKEIKPDTIIINSMTLFWIGAFAKKSSAETICFHRETYIRGLTGFRTSIIKKGLSKWFDKVVFISKHDLEESKKLKSRKFIIYDRVDFNLFNDYSKEQALVKLNLNKDTKYILYLGGFSNLKGSHVIMESFKYLKHLNIKLLFVGGEQNDNQNILKKFKNLFFLTSKSKALKIYNKYELKDSVLFLPKTSTPEILYKASNIVVFPSTKPHQARPIYEAGITKIPIIISDFVETKEFALNNFNALTFKSENSKELANQIEDLLFNKKKKNFIIENNYTLTKKNHDLSSLSKDLNEVLLED